MTSSPSDGSKPPQADLNLDSRALRHINTWKRHCESLRSMHEERGAALQRACGVCGVYALEALYADYGQAVGHHDIQDGAGALMVYVKWGLLAGGSDSSGKDKKITATLEAAGTEELLNFALSTFNKADMFEKKLIESGSVMVDGDWGRVRGLYFSAWEFFGVVEWMAAKGNFFVRNEQHGIGEKRRYAMWRATEIWKAGKEGREVDVRGVGNNRVELAPQAAVEESFGGRPKEKIQQKRSIPSCEKTHLRHSRAYMVGDTVWYSAALRGCSRVKATITRVGWDETDDVSVYDIVEDQAMGEGATRRNVRGESCAPRVEVGDCVVVGDESGDYEEGLVEEIYYSEWPPRYLCLMAGGLEEVEDISLYFDEKEVSLGLSSCEDEEADGDADDVEETGEGNVESGRGKHSDPAPVALAQTGDADVANDADGKSPDAQPRSTSRVEAAKSPSSRQEDVISMIKAEKLCKSAISCISFGDAPSAVRFLQDALDTLTSNS